MPSIEETVTEARDDLQMKRIGWEVSPVGPLIVSATFRLSLMPVAT